MGCYAWAMPRPDFITALTAFVVAVTLVALAALAQDTNRPNLFGMGDYIPSIHCERDSKIEGCLDDVASGPSNTSAQKSMFMIACGSLFAAVFFVACGLTASTTDKLTFQDRLFQLCLALMGVFLAAILFLSQ